jgi:hypothetical protein
MLSLRLQHAGIAYLPSGRPVRVLEHILGFLERMRDSGQGCCSLALIEPVQAVWQQRSDNVGQPHVDVRMRLCLSLQQAQRSAYGAQPSYCIGQSLQFGLECLRFLDFLLPSLRSRFKSTKT